MKLRSTFIILASLFFIPAAFADMSCSAGGCSGVPDYVISWPDGTIRIFPLGLTANVLVGKVDCTPIDSGRAINL